MKLFNIKYSNSLYLSFLIIIGVLIYSFNNPHVNFKEDPPKGIQFFKGDWKAAITKAKMEKKPIFLDIYATWCGPCKKLKKTTFADEKIGEYFNKKFINVSLDGEIGDGSILSEKYGIPAYPSLLVIDTTGKPIIATQGYHTVKELFSFVKSIK